MPPQLGRARPELAERLAAAPAHEHIEIAVDFLRDEVARALGVQPAHTIDIDQGLFEMGMDSLMSVELKGRIEMAVGVNLPSTLTFNYPNIRTLAEVLTTGILSPVAEPADREAAPRVKDDDDDTATPVGVELTEDDLVALLAARLAKRQ